MPYSCMHMVGTIVVQLCMLEGKGNKIWMMWMFTVTDTVVICCIRITYLYVCILLCINAWYAHYTVYCIVTIPMHIQSYSKYAYSIRIVHSLNRYCNRVSGAPSAPLRSHCFWWSCWDTAYYSMTDGGICALQLYAYSNINMYYIILCW